MYLNPDEVITKCELLAERFPDAVTLETLPEPTTEGRAMLLLRIKAGPKAPRHGLYVQANIHAREWGTTDIVLHFVEQLLLADAAGINLVFRDKVFPLEAIRLALHRTELFVVPCVNPDGRAFSMGPGDDPDEFPNHMWRKNRRVTGTGNSCVGVDLNRNCDWIWDFRTAVHPEAQQGVGTSCSGWVSAWDDPCSDPSGTYHGDQPFSEPEARNVRSVLDAHRHIRAFVDLHGVLGAIMVPYADDETQSTDPEQNFLNPTYDRLRGLRDTTGPGCSAPPHADGAAYREFMHRVDLERFTALSNLQRTAVETVHGTRYRTGTSFLEMYGMSGNMNDYAWSRHITQPTCGKVDGYIYEFERVSDSSGLYAYGFQPPFEADEGNAGPDDMIHIIRDVSAGLAALFVNLDRIPIAEHAPATIDFGKVRIGAPKVRTVTVANRGVRTFAVGPASLVGPAGPFSTGTPSAASLAPAAVTTVSVTAAPLNTAFAVGHVAVEFQYEGESVRDVRMVRCTAQGCTVPDGVCVAPTFTATTNAILCFWRVIVNLVLILALALFAWLPSVRCTIKQLWFRIVHCRKGNDDPCLVL